MGRSRPRPLRVVVLAGALALAAGCGTTVSTNDVSGQPGSLSGGSAGATGATTLTGAATGTGGVTSGLGTTTGTGPAGTTGGSSTGVVSGTGSVTSGTAESLPVSPQAPVKIGFRILEGSAGKALALALPPMADARVAWQALVDQQNARGGLHGHKIIPVYFTIDTDGDMAAEEEAACATLTQDNKVMAAFVGYPHTNVLLDCLDRAGIATFTMPSSSIEDAVAYQQRSHHRGVGNLNVTRAANVYVEGLVAQGFFTRGAKIGLVVWDDPGFLRAVDRALKPALARHGLRLSEQANVSPTRGLREAGPTASQNSAAVLQFQTAGITHVLFLGGAGSPGFFFMKAAEGQNYYPQYGLSSNDAPASTSANAGAQTLRNFWGVGWFPIFDTFETPSGPQASACKSLMAKKGQPPAYEYCDSMDVLVAGANRAATPLSASRILAGVDAAGALSLSEFTLDYGAGRRDGVLRARSFRYNTGCSCLRYTSAWYAVP